MAHENEARRTESEGEGRRLPRLPVPRIRIQNRPNVTLSSGFNTVGVTVVISQKTNMAISGEVWDSAGTAKLSDLTFPAPPLGQLIVNGVSQPINASQSPSPYVVNVSLIDTSKAQVVDADSQLSST